MGAVDIIIIVVYMLAMVGVGIYANTKIKTKEDFILGGRRFGTVSLVGTIMATMMGSGMVIGMISNVYNNGIAGSIVWQYGGMAVGMFAIAICAHKIRETDSMTFAEIIGKAFGKNARMVAAIVVVLYTIGILSLTVAGLRTVIITIFGDSLAMSDVTLTILATCIAIAYTFFGGFYAVVWTEVVQYCIIVGFIFILGSILGVSQAGGLENISAAIEAKGGSMTTPVFTPAFLGLAISYFLATPGDPTLPQRALAARNTKSARKAFAISGAMSVVIIICLLLLGGSIAVILPDLANPDAAISAYVLNSFPPVIKGMTIAALLAAIMSTFDSFLVLGTTHLTYDILGTIKKEVSDKDENRVQRIAVLGFGAATVIIASYISSILGALTVIFSVLGAVTMPALVAALWFKDKASRVGVIAGMITGCLVPIYLFATRGYDVFLGDPIVLGLISSVAVLVLGSVFFKDKKVES